MNLDIVVWTVVIMVACALMDKWHKDAAMSWFLRGTIFANLMLLCMHVYVMGAHLFFEQSWI
jgi:hypothetical protein